MKNLFIIISFFTITFACAQTSYFVDKKGKKTIIRDDSVEFILSDKRIAYAEYGKSWEKFIKYEDIDNAIIGDYYLKSYQIVNNGKVRKSQVYFIIAETESKELICFTYSIIGKNYLTTIYDIYVIDENNTVLDSFYIMEGSQVKGAVNNIIPTLKKHFSECSEFMNILESYNDSAKSENSILSLFNKPTYISCDSL